MIARGRVLELHRWPVKSMAGEPVDALRLDTRGAAGDRTHAVWDVHRGAPRRLTARQAPALLAWGAAYPGADGASLVPEDPPSPVLTAPDGATTYAWEDPALPGALAASLGREVALRRDLRGQQDLADSVLVTSAATHAALEAELGAAIDLRRWRTNAHVELDAAPYAEEGWEGAQLRIGDAELDLLHPCERCVIPTRDPDTQDKWSGLLKHLFREHRGLFGMNARPRGPATIRVGDPVVLTAR